MQLARPGYVLLGVWHEDVALLCKNIRIDSYRLRDDREEQIVLLDLHVVEVEGKPTLWTAVQKTNCFVVQIVKFQLLGNHLRVVAEGLHLTRVPNWFFVYEPVEGSDGKLEQWIVFAFLKVQLYLFNVVPIVLFKQGKRLFVFVFYQLISCPSQNAQCSSIFFQAVAYLLVYILRVPNRKQAKVGLGVRSNDNPAPLVVHGNNSHG